MYAHWRGQIFFYLVWCGSTVDDFQICVDNIRIQSDKFDPFHKAPQDKKYDFKVWTTGLGPHGFDRDLSISHISTVIPGCDVHCNLLLDSKEDNGDYTINNRRERLCVPWALYSNASPESRYRLILPLWDEKTETIHILAIRPPELNVDTKGRLVSSAERPAIKWPEGHVDFDYIPSPRSESYVLHLGSIYVMDHGLLTPLQSLNDLDLVDIFGNTFNHNSVVVQMEIRSSLIKMVGMDRLVKNTLNKRSGAVFKVRDKSPDPLKGDLTQLIILNPDEELGFLSILHCKCGTGRDVYISVPPNINSVEEAHNWISAATGKLELEVRT